MNDTGCRTRRSLPFEARFLELFHRISLGFSQAFTACVAALQRIVSQYISRATTRSCHQSGKGRLAAPRQCQALRNKPMARIVFKGVFTGFTPGAILKRTEK